MKETTERGTVRKNDLTQNEDLPKIERMIKAQKAKEKKLHALRLNSKTVIYVSKNKNNREYAEKRRIELGLQP